MSHSVTLTASVPTLLFTSQHGKTCSLDVAAAMDVDQRPGLSESDARSAMTQASTASPVRQSSSQSSTHLLTQPSTVSSGVQVTSSASSQPSLDNVNMSTGIAERDHSLVPTANTKKGHLQTSYFATNLLSLFKMDGLAASVARFDPATGEKINKMRKSYEGQLKTLPLAGKNKSIRHEEANASSALMGLVEISQWPAEEWQNQKVYGKDIKNGLSDATKAKIEKAMEFRPGSVPDTTKWDDILGIDRVVPSSIKSRKDVKPGSLSSNGMVQKGPPTNSNTDHLSTTDTLGTKGDHIRARRNTKKRRYDDGSFEGYGEGFVDDELDHDAGYESGETYTSRGSKGERKRRKTKEFSTQTPNGPSRSASFAMNTQVR